jgi:hypothetical protein
MRANERAFVDAVAGQFIFVANKGIEIRRRDATLVQHVNQTVSSGADGMAFDASSPRFVVSVDTAGAITRYDFPNDDYALAPTQSVLASGGGRGDLAQVGADGCLYLSMGGTMVADGTQTSAGSLVMLCGGFSPTVPAADLEHLVAGGSTVQAGRGVLLTENWWMQLSVCANYGAMLWFRWKTFSGSYRRFTSRRRS